MKKGIEFLVYSNLWISFGAVSFALLFYSLCDLTPSVSILGFLFFSTLLTYNFQRLEKIRKNDRTAGPRIDWMIQNRNLINVLLLVAALGTIFFSLQLSIKSLVYLSGMGVISFFYVFKIKKYSLRDLPLLKILLIGIVWSGSCFIIPYFEINFSISYSILHLALAAALYILAITIPFDIRDLDVDEKSKYTIPQLLGDRLSRLLALVLLGFSVLIFHESGVSLNVGFWLGIFASALLIVFALTKRKELYFSLGVDGLLIVVGLGSYLFNIL